MKALETGSRRRLQLEAVDILSCELRDIFNRSRGLRSLHGSEMLAQRHKGGDFASRRELVERHRPAFVVVCYANLQVPSARATSDGTWWGLSECSVDASNARRGSKKATFANSVSTPSIDNRAFCVASDCLAAMAACTLAFFSSREAVTAADLGA